MSTEKKSSPTLFKGEGLEIAEQVYNEVKALLDGIQKQAFIAVTGFYNYKCTGYHFSVMGRGITVINNPVSDQIRLVFGESSHFHPDTHHAQDVAGFVDLPYDGQKAAAKIVVDFLLDAKAPAQQEPHPPSRLVTWPSYTRSDVMEPGIQASVQRRHMFPEVDTLGILQRAMKERAPLRLPDIYQSLSGPSAESTIGTLSDAEILLQEVPGGAEQVATPPNQAARNSYLRGRTDRKLSRIVRLLQTINPLIPLEQLELELSTFSSYPFVSTDRILGLAELFKARHHREFLVDRARKVSQNFIEQGAIEYVVGVAKVPAGGEVEIRLLASEHHLAVHCPDFPAQTRYFRTFSGARSFFYRLCKDLRRGSLQSGHAIIHGNLTPF